MRVTATNVKPGDRVRGIGLVVEDVVPETDFTTAITGHVSTREEDGEFGVFSGTRVVLPNEHVVNVVRSDENFRADRLEAVETTMREFYESPAVEAEDEEMGALVEKLTAIANQPRHAYTTADQVADLFVMGELDGTESADEVLTKLDELAQA